VTPNVHAVVATYRPGTNLCQLTRSLRQEHLEVSIVDDASPCTYDHVFRSCQSDQNVAVFRHKKSEGIARSLNIGMQAAKQHEAQWLLTLDQDSSLAPKYVLAAKHFLHQISISDLSIGACGAAIVADANGVNLRYPVYHESGFTLTHEVIQSGTFWLMSALDAIGGFDETLRMDAVDAAACLRMREMGYRSALIPNLTLHHSIGNAQTYRLFGRDVMVTGHSSERRTTMLRNRLKLFPAEFRQSPRHAMRTIRRVAINQGLGLVTETDRAAKAKGSLRGLRLRRDR